MQPRRIARELALLSIGQLSTSTQLTESQEIDAAMLAAIRTLSEEVRETLETASADLNRSSDRILESEIRATDITSARTMLQDAIDLTQSAINRLGTTLELPEFIHIAQSRDVREFAYSLIRTCRTRRTELDEILTKALVDWQLSRIAKIDRNILRLAVAEICILGIPDRVAINEAVELGKRYSTEDGHRFINGVLRRVTQNQANPQQASPIEISTAPPAAIEPVEEVIPPVALQETPHEEPPETVSPEPQPFVAPPVVPFNKQQFAPPPDVSEVKPGLDIQEIIPAPPKRVIPSPTKKRVIPSPSRHSKDKKRVIPSPGRHQERKRVIPTQKVSKGEKQGIDVPILKSEKSQSDKGPQLPYQRADVSPPESSSIPASPWSSAMAGTAKTERMPHPSIETNDEPRETASSEFEPLESMSLSSGAEPTAASVQSDHDSTESPTLEPMPSESLSTPAEALKNDSSEPAGLDSMPSESLASEPLPSAPVLETLPLDLEPSTSSVPESNDVEPETVSPWQAAVSESVPSNPPEVEQTESASEPAPEDI